MLPVEESHTPRIKHGVWLLLKYWGIGAQETGREYKQKRGSFWIMLLFSLEKLFHNISHVPFVEFCNQKLAAVVLSI